MLGRKTMFHNINFDNYEATEAFIGSQKIRFRMNDGLQQNVGRYKVFTYRKFGENYLKYLNTTLAIRGDTYRHIIRNHLVYDELPLCNFWSIK